MKDRLNGAIRKESAMPYDRVYSLRIPEEIREALEKIAQKERRSLSSLILKIITDYLDDHGVSWIKDDQVSVSSHENNN